MVGQLRLAMIDSFVAGWRDGVSIVKGWDVCAN